MRLLLASSMWAGMFEAYMAYDGFQVSVKILPHTLTLFMLAE